MDLEQVWYGHTTFVLNAALVYGCISDMASEKWAGVEHWARCESKTKIKRWREIRLFLNDRGWCNSISGAAEPGDVGDDLGSFLNRALDLEKSLLASALNLAKVSGAAGDADAEDYATSLAKRSRKRGAHLAVLVALADGAKGDVAALYDLDQRLQEKGK